MRTASFLLLFTATLSAQSDFYLKDGDTVVFYGDSITEQRLYTVFTEAYVLTRFPRLHVSFVHSGWGGDRVTGGGGGPIDLRLKRDVLAYQPTVMTIMLGMNDARYTAFDPATYQTFSNGYDNIIKTVKTALPNIRITAIQPSPYDDVTRPPTFAGGYNAVLVRYGDYVRELAQREKLRTADLNTGVVAALKTANQNDHDQALQIIPDRIHPAAGGHMLMAEALLKSWNAPAIVAAVEINAATGAVTRSENTRVAEVNTRDGVSWIETDQALPMPVDWNNAVTSLAVRSSDFVDALDQEPLTITGLPPGNYTLRIDGDPVGTFTADQLSASVNLAPLATPMSAQALEVLQLTYYHNHLRYTSRRFVSFPLTKYGFETTRPAIDALDLLENDVVGAQRAVAQPKPHRFELRPVR
ncbi:MAG: SGNH/GDSL hydrolase family protein [Acidobacteriota bacterium]|nr:SGNH/GDSL hydrolase family protein [Acidobacteriota bacterium]